MVNYGWFLEALQEEVDDWDQIREELNLSEDSMDADTITRLCQRLGVRIRQKEGEKFEDYLKRIINRVKNNKKVHKSRGKSRTKVKEVQETVVREKETKPQLQTRIQVLREELTSFRKKLLQYGGVFEGEVRMIESQLEKSAAV